MHPNLLAALESYARACHLRSPADILAQAALRKAAAAAKAQRTLLRCVDGDLQSP